MNVENNLEKYKLDPNRWLETIPKKQAKNLEKKYYFTIILFIFGLISVSLIKNEARNLQKEIDFLQSSIRNLKINLHETTLDFEFITSPENISELSNKYLSPDFIFYKRSQIKQPGESNKNWTMLEDFPEEQVNKKEVNKKQVSKKEKYSLSGNFDVILNSKKLEDIYDIDANKVKYKKLKNWGLTQVFKSFLGIPPIPGK